MTDEDFYDDSSYQEWDSSNWDEDEDEYRIADFIYQEEEETEEW